MSTHETNDHDPSHPSDFADLAGEPQHEFDPPQAVRIQRRVAGGGGLLLFAGFCLAAGSAALAVAPEYSWQATRIARLLASNGVGFDTLFVGGVVLMGLGIVARGVRSVGRIALENAEGPATDAMDMPLVIDQLLADMAQLKGAVHEVALQVAAAGESQRHAAESAPAEEGARGDQDAMFRLASSLDKLGARLEERFASEMDGTRRLLEDFTAHLDQLHPAAAAQPAPVTQAAAAPAGPSSSTVAMATEGGAALTSAAGPFAEPTGAPPVPAGPAPGPRSTLLDEDAEELEIVVDLEDDEDLDEKPILDFFDHLEDYDTPPDADLGGPAPQVPPQGLGQDVPVESLDVDEPAAPPASYDRSLDKLLPDDSVRRAVEDQRDDGREQA